MPKESSGAQGGLYELFERVAKRAGLSNLSRFVRRLGK
jgi:hypothetical protein